MVIAGLQKNSLIDFPGKVACVVFLAGCNFFCPFCHNPELVGGAPLFDDPADRITVGRLLAFLRPRRMLLDGVVITGGEPTLSPGLADLCRAIRKMGLAVKLDTNGSRPDVLAYLLSEQLLDYIAMDIKTELEAYRPPLAREEVQSRITQSLRLVMDSGLDYEFRTTCVEPFVNETRILPMARAIQGANRYVLQSFRPTKLLNPGYFGDTDPAIPPAQMERLRELAAPWVRHCLIRV